MRVIMTGGGTGGHIYPAVAIADRIKERTLDSEILFIGTEKGLEKDLVPKCGYDIRFIPVCGINRRNILKNFKTAKEYIAGKKQAKKIMEEFKPDVVIGTGGYVCGPVVKVAASMGIKTYVHEQNAVPGLTNKFLESKVNGVFLGFEEAGKNFKHPEKHVVAGNPVRDGFFQADKQESRKELNIGDEFTIMSFGGSQGAGRINRAMIDVVEKYNGDDNVRIIFVTGKRFYEPVLKEFEDRNIHIESNIEIKEYVYNMEKYISAVDLVISRSGALAVSEIAVCATPSILIPSPNVTGNHQYFNAKAIADKGGAVLMEEKDLTGENISNAIEKISKDKEFINEMSKMAKACAPLDAADIVYYHIINE